MCPLQEVRLVAQDVHIWDMKRSVGGPPLAQYVITAMRIEPVHLLIKPGHGQWQPLGMIVRNNGSGCIHNFGAYLFLIKVEISSNRSSSVFFYKQYEKEDAGAGHQHKPKDIVKIMGNPTDEPYGGSHEDSGYKRVENCKEVGFGRRSDQRTDHEYPVGYKKTGV